MKSSNVPKRTKEEIEGLAYIRSIMKAWARDYELNAVGEIVKKTKTISDKSQQSLKR